MAETLTEHYADGVIGVGIVWLPMVDTDNERAAQQMSGMFGDTRVRQFWDPDRRCGTAYTQHVFPRWARQAFSDVPEEDVSSRSMYAHSEEPLEQWPAWDIVMFYGRGVEWTDIPPAPVHWACQHSFHGKRPDGTSGLFWRNEFRAKPFASDWVAEVGRGMTALSKMP